MKKFSFIAVLVLLSCWIQSEAQNLVAHYPFNGNANDVSGNGYNGQIKNASLGADRYLKSDECYYFDGDGDYIVLPNSFDYAQKTISLWFNAFSIPSSDKVIIGNDQGNLQYAQFGIDVRQGNTLHLAVGNVGSNVQISTNKWYHLVLVIGASEYKFYVNGELAATNNYTKYHSIDGFSGTHIGVNRKENGAFFIGAVDEIKVFNVALNDTEAKNLYSQYMFTENRQESFIEIYPNPFKDKININNPILNSTIRLFNLQGEIVFETSNSGIIDLENLESGLYLMQCIDSEGTVRKQIKLLKQ